MKPVTILHLSDLQFGCKSRFGQSDTSPDHSGDTLWSRIKPDLAHLGSHQGISVDLVVVTGDLSETGHPEELKSAFTFLGDLAVELKLGRDRVVVVPGNHDISRHHCKKYFDDCEYKKTTPKSPFSEKWKPFADEFEQFYEGCSACIHGKNCKRCQLITFKVSDGNPWSFYRLEDLSVFVAGFNSTMAECHDIAESDPKFGHLVTSGEYGHFGFCGISQVQWFEEKLKLYQHENWLRIAVLHHNVGGDWKDAAHGLHDEEKLKQLSARDRINMIMHGHTHRGDQGTMNWNVPVLSTGSAAIEAGERPTETPNQYQIVQVFPDKVRALARAYEPIQDRWIGDTRVSPDGDDWQYEQKLQLVQVSRAFPFASSLSTLSSLTVGERAWYKRFICPTENSPIIIAHCDFEKIPDPAAPAGIKLQGVLSQLGLNPVIRPLNTRRVGEPDLHLLRDLPGTLVLVDSPLDNTYSNYVLLHYLHRLGGGSIRHVHMSVPGKGRIQTVEAGNQIFESDKHRLPQYHEERGKPMKHVFGGFKDCLVLMRLPRTMLKKDPDRDSSDVIWLLYGITPKGTNAGVEIMRPENMRAFEERIGKRLPRYFEAVLRVSSEQSVVRDFTGLEIGHFAELWLRRDLCLGDPVPESVKKYFGSHPERNKEMIPLSFVHLDLVAGCNYRCPGCIETKARNLGLCLTLEKITKVLVDIHELGCRNLRFYGGEPTLYPKFGFVIRQAFAMGFDVMVITNGSLLGVSQVADALVHAKHRLHLRVSVDANTKVTHGEQHGITHTDQTWKSYKQSIDDLVNRGVTLSVSYLIRKNSLDELIDACSYWHDLCPDTNRRRAVSFSARIPMNSEGKWVDMDGIEDRTRELIQELSHTYGEWFVVPDWLKAWKSGARPCMTSVEFKRCYSAYYRFGISPDSTETKVLVMGSDGATQLYETENARISFCLFRRYADSPLGCAYPVDLAEWARRDRVDYLEKIVPKELCTGRFCSRVAANREVELG